MAYVSVPKDLTQVKPKFLFNLTKRQVICFGGGAALGLPLFFLINSYTTGLSASAMKYIADIRLLSKRSGSSVADEIGLPVKRTGLALPCGSSVRVTFNKE